MTVLTAATIGVLFASGLFLLMSRSIVRLILGLVLMGHAANLVIFVGGGLTRGLPPLVSDAAKNTADAAPPTGHADPLPQALVLTAIVIGFAVSAFAAVLVRQVYAAIGSEDTDAMTSTDKQE